MRAIYSDPTGDPSGLAAARAMAMRPVRRVMTSPVVCVAAAATLADALRVMAGGGLRHLAVVDGDGRCLGILSDRAVTAIWAADPGALSHRSAADTLGPVPAVVAATATVRQAARRMVEAGGDAVAVVDADAAVLGIVTGGDLIRLLAR